MTRSAATAAEEPGLEAAVGGIAAEPDVDPGCGNQRADFVDAPYDRTAPIVPAPAAD